MIRNLVEEIDRRAVAVVDDIVERGECEFVTDVAAKVPIQTICAMIGLDDDHSHRAWSSCRTCSSDRSTTPTTRHDPGASELAAMEIYALCDQVAAGVAGETRATTS